MSGERDKEGRWREGVVHMLIVYICEQCICMLQIIASSYVMYAN